MLRGYTLADQDALAERLKRVHRTRESGAVSDFVWACWDLHAYLADMGKGVLLNTLYLSIMDVGTTYVRAKLETTAPEEVDLNPLAEVMDDIVDALARRDHDAAIAALRRTVPTVILHSPAEAREHTNGGRPCGARGNLQASPGGGSRQEPIPVTTTDHPSLPTD